MGIQDSAANIKIKKINKKSYLKLIQNEKLLQRILKIFKKRSICLFSAIKELHKDVDKYAFDITDCCDCCKVTRRNKSFGVQFQVIQYVSQNLYTREWWNVRKATLVNFRKVTHQNLHNQASIFP